MEVADKQQRELPEGWSSRDPKASRSYCTIGEMMGNGGGKHSCRHEVHIELI